MKGSMRWLLISAALTLGVCVAGIGISCADDASPPAAGVSSGAQTVQVLANNETPAQTTTPPAKSSAATAAQDTNNVPVTEVTVTAQKPKPATGAAAEGYRVESTTTTGPWGEMKLQDAPYSISVMSSELIENVQASDPYQLFKMNPLTQTTYLSTANDLQAANIRGFYVLSPLRDGIPTINTSYGVSLENLERVEVKSGPSGFLYGAGSLDVGGWINYVTKRPTEERLNNVTVGDYGGSQYYVHGDFGGPIDKQGKFGYRINLVDQPDNNTAIQHQSLKRDLFSGAFDWHATDKLLFQVDYEHRDYDRFGHPPFWYTASGVLHPSAPNADKLYSQTWTRNTVTTDAWGSNAKWDITDIFTFRAAYRHQEDTRRLLNAQNTIQANGTYIQALTDWAPNQFINDGYYSYLDSKFKTAFIEHTLTVGYSGNTYENRLHQDNAGNITITGLTLSDPFVSEPAFPAHGTKPVYTPYTIANQNWTIGDDIKFNEQWSALIGVNDARIEAKSAYVGSKATYYDKTANTPTVSVIYKPIPWISTYATYMEALEQGTIVGSTYANAGTILKPLVDRQYELGAKANVTNRILLTTALFRIDKANQYSIPTTPLPTYVQDGREVHQGVEFTATGKATDRLTVFGGFTLMDCTVERTSSASLVGKRPVNVANQYAKLYAEYSLPWVKGLTLTGGIYYTGSQFADPANTDLLSAYTIGDIGARYETKIDAHTTIFRLNVTNVTDKSYWSNSYQVGEPRSIMLSMQIKF